MMEFKKSDTSLISAEYADYINHTYGNVRDKEDGCIKQYVFKEGDRFEDVLKFIDHYYPGICGECLDS